MGEREGGRREAGEREGGLELVLRLFVGDCLWHHNLHDDQGIAR